MTSDDRMGADHGGLCLWRDDAGHAGADAVWLYARPPADAAGRHALVRRHLAAVLGCAVGAVRLGAAAGGKPRLEAPTARLGFNLSRRDGLLLLATAWDRDVGADIDVVPPESGDRAADDAGSVAAVARTFFTPGEVGWLDSLAPAARTVGFTRIWTAKEAVLKARGTGIADGLRDPDLTGHVRAGRPLDAASVTVTCGRHPYVVRWFTLASDAGDATAAAAWGLRRGQGQKNCSLNDGLTYMP